MTKNITGLDTIKLEAMSSAGSAIWKVAIGGLGVYICCVLYVKINSESMPHIIELVFKGGISNFIIVILIYMAGYYYRATRKADIELKDRANVDK